MKILLIASVILATPIANAAPKVTPAAVPQNLHVYDQNGNTYIDHLPHDCTSKRYYISPNLRAYDQIVAILLSAQIAQKKVVLRYNGCTNRGTQGKVIGVYLK
jgi:hypothetical protein